MEPQAETLLDGAARLYDGAGRYDRHFARSKIRRDPAYLAVLRGGWLPDRGALVDLGCGRGLLLALLASARERFARGLWPREFPPPPSLDLHGIERREDHVEVARGALAGRAQVEQGDLLDAALPACSAIVLLDVLFYLGAGAQLDALRTAVAALEPGGVLLVREADADAGLGFRVTRGAERALEVLRGRAASRLHYRSAAEWAMLLRSLGLTVSVEPMSAGTPFANMLFICKKDEG
jgi:SAM-dependent methyltransferase